MRCATSVSVRLQSSKFASMWIQFRTREPFAFPGLWDCWIDRETGKPLYTFTIITSHANALLRRIHNRMPVMYRRDMGKQSLEESIRDDLILSLVMQPVLSEEVEAYEVSTLVNSPEHDSPDCVRRALPKEPKTPQLPL